MAIEAPVIRIPTGFNVFARSLLGGFFDRFLAPAMIDIVDDATEKASALIQEGYGLIVLGAHFSRREGFELAIRPARYIKEVLHGPIVLPISLHQYVRSQGLLDFVGRVCAYTIAPVVNDDAMERAQEIEKLIGRKVNRLDGVLDYARMVKSSLNLKGTAGMAPQAGRRATMELSQAKSRPLELLLRMMKDNKKTAFLFMPMSPWKNGSDYHKLHDSYNFGSKYDIRLGPCLTYDEMISLLGHVNKRLAEEPVESGKNSITIDELALIILSVAEDPDYSKVDKGYGLEYLMAYIDQFVDVMSAARDLI